MHAIDRALPWLQAVRERAEREAYFLQHEGADGMMASLYRIARYPSEEAHREMERRKKAKLESQKHDVTEKESDSDKAKAISGNHAVTEAAVNGTTVGDADKSEKGTEEAATDIPPSGGEGGDQKKRQSDTRDSEDGEVLDKEVKAVELSEDELKEIEHNEKTDSSLLSVVSAKRLFESNVKLNTSSIPPLPALLAVCEHAEVRWSFAADQLLLLSSVRLAELFETLTLEQLQADLLADGTYKEEWTGLRDVVRPVCLFHCCF